MRQGANTVLKIMRKYAPFERSTPGILESFQGLFPLTLNIVDKPNSEYAL
jgi:hypothetical protein